MRTEEFDYNHTGRSFGAYAAYDETLKGKRPGVLVIHDLWGLGEQTKERARRLAELGYVGLAIDLFGDRFQPKALDEALPIVGEMRADARSFRDRLLAGLEQLAKHPEVDSSRLGAIGFCLGGISVLELARDGADLKGVVCFHGNLDAVEPAKKGAVKAKVLVCTGGGDGIVPDTQISTFQDEMRNADADWQVNVYGGAEHSFTNIYADRAGIPGVSYHEKADRRSWEAMRGFFGEAFAK